MRVSESLLFKEGPERGKPFSLTLEHIKELVTTSVGFSLGLASAVDFSADAKQKIKDKKDPKSAE